MLFKKNPVLSTRLEGHSGGTRPLNELLIRFKEVIECNASHFAGNAPEMWLLCKPNHFKLDSDEYSERSTPLISLFLRKKFCRSVIEAKVEESTPLTLVPVRENSCIFTILLYD